MNQKQICPKCGKEIPNDVELCPSCGTRVREKKPIATQSTTEQEKSRKTSALVYLAIALVGIIVIFAYRAWLGGLIYLVAGGLSIMALNSDYEANLSPSLPSYIMSCLKGKDIWNKILAIIIVLIPILVIFSTYRWIVVDTAREVDSMMSDIYELLGGF